MKEITDKDLAAILANPCFVSGEIVQSLVARLDRVEGENVRWKQSSDRHLGNLLREKGKCADCVISDGAWSERAVAAEAENTALRERVKRMEALQAEPHDARCWTVKHTMSPDVKCTCWKAKFEAALKEGE